MNKKHYIDLSDIKEDDLDKTASFTDLMSRSEKLEHKRKKEEEQTRELKEILMNDEEKKEKKKRKNNKKVKNDIIDTKNEKQQNKDNFKDSNIDNLSKTQKILELTNEIKTSMLNNVDDNLEKKKKRGIGNILIIDLLIIISLAYYIYSILFTDIQTNQLYLLIGGCFILGMIALFCISMVSNKTMYKIFSVLNYLTFSLYVIFNLTLVLGIINL